MVWVEVGVWVEVRGFWLFGDRFTIEDEGRGRGDREGWGCLGKWGDWVGEEGMGKGQIGLQFLRVRRDW